MCIRDRDGGTGTSEDAAVMKRELSEKLDSILDVHREEKLIKMTRFESSRLNLE